MCAHDGELGESRKFLSCVLYFSSSSDVSIVEATMVVRATSSCDVVKSTKSVMPAKHNFHDELSTYVFCNFIISALKMNM